MEEADVPGMLAEDEDAVVGLDGEGGELGHAGGDDNGDGGNVARLRRAMMAEQAAPEVLPFKSELVGAVLAAVSEREEQLEEAESSTEDDESLAAALYLTEVKRIKYMLRVYLRTRLKKIETYVLHILNSDELYGRLSEQEQEFARNYTDAMDQLFTSSVLSQIPENFDSLLKQSDASSTNDMIAEPNYDTHVFCRIREDVGTVELDSSGRSVDLNPGDLCIIRYRPIQPLVLEERLELW